MEILKLFPIDFFVFYNKNFDNKKLIANLETLEDIQIKKTTQISLLINLKNNKNFQDLFNWFSDCLKEVKKIKQYDCDQIKITNSWVNVSLADYNMYLDTHKHSMSFYSGIYYLTDGSATTFIDPFEQAIDTQLQVLKFNYHPEEKISPEPGKLIIFPSYIYHKSDIHIANTSRYIISFNTMPTGKINYNLATDSKINIKIEDD
jgi:uncharacterized protein (TIGR02466 family)